MRCLSYATIAAPPGLEMSLQIIDLAPGDTGTIQQVFGGLSATSSYQRYQSARPTLPIRTLRRLADVRAGRHVAHVAMLNDEPVGIVRWIRPTRPRPTQPNTGAELAIEVVDAYQRQGIGRLLLAHAAGSAIAAGLDCFQAYISNSNRSLIRRVLEYGAVADRTDPELFRLSTAQLQQAISVPGPAGGR